MADQVQYLGFGIEGFKGGRIRPETKPRLHFTNYTSKELPTPPDNVDYGPAAQDCLKNVYLNDQYGDCVVAGAYHVLGILTGNAGDLYIAPDKEIKSIYNKYCGPGDNGCNEQDFLGKLVDQGFGNGTKLIGWMGVDATKPLALKQACYLFEHNYYGVEMPDSWVNPMPQEDGFVWDVAGSPNPGYGHCIMSYGYNDKGMIICTWGMKGIVTWKALSKYMVEKAGGEAYIMLTDTMLAKGQRKAPNGFDWFSLVKDFNEMGGDVPLPPQPAPLPQPPPNPDPLPPPAPVDDEEGFVNPTNPTDFIVVKRTHYHLL